MKQILIITLTLLCLSSCKKDDENRYYIKYQDKTYGISGARILREGLVNGTNLQNLYFYLHGKNITFNMAEEKGNGPILKLELLVDSSRLRTGNYQTSNETENYTIVAGKKNEKGERTGSYFKSIPANKEDKDTVFTYLKSGKLYITPASKEGQFLYQIKFVNAANDSVSGNFEGNYLFQNDVDGIKVGEITIGDSIYQLQRGDMMLWGDIFNKNVNYYELFFYSTTMRYTEIGQFQKGLVLVLGIQSKGKNEPEDGTYPLSRAKTANTALTGRKEGSIDWGCYWHAYTSSSAFQKAFITSNEISVKKNGKKFDVTFACIDQLGDSINGSYTSDFNVIDLRK